MLDLNDPRDFTDSMLIEIEKTTDKSSSFYGEGGVENLRNTLFDLFIAGSETTSSTLTWAALYMVRYPQVQKKVQAELDRVVGQNRPPSLKDKPNLPYTEVFIKPMTRSCRVNCHIYKISLISYLYVVICMCNYYSLNWTKEQWLLKTKNYGPFSSLLL